MDNFKAIKLLFFVILVFNLTFSQDVTYLRQQAKKLSSDKMNGRGYVQNGLEKAAGYIHHQFDSLKLRAFEKDYCQKFKYPVNTFPDELIVSINYENLAPGRDFLVDPSSGSSSGIYEPMYFNRTNINELPDPGRLIIPGKRLILVLDPTGIEDNEQINFFESQKNMHADHMPVIWLTEDKLTWSVSNQSCKEAIIVLKKSLYEEGLRSIEIDVKNKFIKAFDAMNLLGYIKGKAEPDSFIVFTAHYDHLGMMGEKARFNGGNDNASGCAYLLELARHYASQTNKYSMVFIAFAGEEAGLIGSKYYTEHPLFGLEKIKFLLNMDLMGYGDEGITVVNGTLFENQFKTLTKINARDSLLSKVKIRGPAANSDHYWFTQKGIPSFFIYTLGGNKAYHDIYDVYDNLTFVEFIDLFTLITSFIEEIE